MDEDITINGPLTLDAGTFIRTNFSSTIFGATQVTLTLNASAQISETQVEGVSTLFFDATSGSGKRQCTAGNRSYKYDIDFLVGERNRPLVDACQRFSRAEYQP